MNGTFFNSIDYKLLRKQKEELISVVDHFKENAIGAKALVALQWILNLVDGLQDAAVSEFKIKESTVFGKLQSYETVNPVKKVVKTAKKVVKKGKK